MANTQNLHEVATLTSLEGKGFVRHSDGTRSELVAGMKLSLGDIVITMPGGRASVQILDGRHFDLARTQGDAIKIDQTVLDVLTDIQDVRVTDLSLVYPFVAHHIVTDPTVDPLSLVNDDNANDLSQISAMDVNDEPAAQSDAGGGDLLSGNTYVVLHANPLVTDTAPFNTEPGHFNHAFTPTIVPAFVPSVTPLVHLLAEHTPVAPAVDPGPAYQPIISLAMASTQVLDANNQPWFDNSGPTPMVDDEAGSLAYTVTTTNHDDPQTFNVMIFDLANPDGFLLRDGDPVTGDPHVVDPMSVLDTNNDHTYTDTFYVPILEGQEGQTITVKLVPTDFTSVKYTSQELSSAFTVGELGSETEVSPASLHISIAAPTIDWTESSNGELVATYQLKLLDATDQEVKLDHALTVHWVLQNHDFSGLNVESDVTFAANTSTAEIVANVPEEDASNNNLNENYTLGLLLDNNVNVTSGGHQLMINPVTAPTDLSNYLQTQPTHANQFLVSTNTELSFLNDAQNENSEAFVNAQFSTFVDGMVQLDDHADNAPIQFTITSSELEALVGHATLSFDINVYDESQNLIGTLMELDASAGSLHNGHQLVFDVPLDLSKIHLPGTDLNSLTPQYVSEDNLHDLNLTFKIEAVSDAAIALFNNLDQSLDSVTGHVINDKDYESASEMGISVDHSAIDNTNSGIAIFSNNQVVDYSLTTSEKKVYDEFVKFNVNFDKQFGDATFDVVVDGTNGVHTVSTINFGVNAAGVIQITDINNNIVAYETSQTSMPADISALDYVLNTDGTSVLTLFVALPNTEDNPQYTVSLLPNASALAASDINGNVFEALNTDPLAVTTSVPYNLVPDVHVTATIVDQSGSASIDDEAPIGFTINLDHALSAETQYQVTIQAGDGTIVYQGNETVNADAIQQGFIIDPSQFLLPLDSLVDPNLSITLSDMTAGQVNIYGQEQGVRIDVVNDPLATVLVTELVNDPVTITLTAPTLPIDDENPATPDPVFAYHVEGEFLADTGLSAAQFDVYSQPTDSAGVATGSQVLLTTITLDLTQGGLTNFAFDSTFPLPLSLFADGYQEIILVPKDTSLPTVTSSVFDVVDVGSQLVHQLIGGIDTYSLIDTSDNTSTPVGGGGGQGGGSGEGQGGEGGGQGGQGDPLSLSDLIAPEGSNSNIHLDFGDNAFVASEGDFRHREFSGNPITEIVYDENHPGLVSFAGDEGSISINSDNVQQAIDFLALNSRHHEGATVEFNVAVNDTQTDTYVFHQSAGGGYSVANITNIESVAGVDPQQIAPITIHIDNH